MDLSIFLGQVIGLFLVVKGIAILLNKQMLMSSVQAMTKSNVGMMGFGAMAFVLGSLIVLSHNVWVEGWPVLITIFGWIILIKGGLFMLFPDHMVKKMKKMNTEGYYTIEGIIVLIVGAVLVLATF